MNTLPPPQKNPVFEQVKKERSATPKMSELEILSKGTKGKIDPNRLYSSLSQLVQTDPKVRIFRANNSLFVIYNNGQGNAEVVMETADKPRELVDSIKQFFQAMKAVNFKNINFSVENPDIIRVIKMGGYEPKLSGVGGKQMSAMVEV
jgi:hypothetical protein